MLLIETASFAPAARLHNFHYAIRNIVTAAEQLERRGRVVTYLNIGDPQVYGFRPPAHVTEAVVRALRDEFTGYAHSAGLWNARVAVADEAAAQGLPELTPDDVFITAGASEAADLLLTALLNRGDEVLLPAPGYPIYPAILAKLEAQPVYYHLDAADDWQPDTEALARLITPRTRALVLINPNNPTGSLIPDATVKRLLELARRHDLLVIADEVYRELCFAEAPTSAAVLARDTQTPVVVLESLSKTHLVPGWRVGWMRFHDGDELRDLKAAVLKLAGGRLCAPTPAQYAVQPALRGDKTFMRSFIEDLRQRRDYALGRVAQIRGLSASKPVAAFYMMLQVADWLGDNDERRVLELLSATGMLVVHGSGFGADARAGSFRLVYLPDETVLARFFDALTQYLA